MAGSAEFLLGTNTLTSHLPPMYVALCLPQTAKFKNTILTSTPTSWTPTEMYENIDVSENQPEQHHTSRGILGSGHAASCGQVCPLAPMGEGFL